MNESELIQAARGGDEAAFEQLVRLHEKKIYNLCLRMCGSSEDAAEAAQDTFLALWRGLEGFREDAAEAAQDTFLALWRGLEGFREDAALSTWLYRLASNACIDLLRRNKRTVDGVSLDDEDVHLEVCDRAPTPEEHVEGRETQRLVREGLAALPEDYRRVLVLRELHQLSYAEICEVTELELGTVKSRINRARLLLRNYLAADGNFFEKPASKVTECNQTVGGERNAI